MSESWLKTSQIAALLAVIPAAFAFLILRVAPNTAFPLLDVSRGTLFYPFTVGAIFVGAFTSNGRSAADANTVRHDSAMAKTIARDRIFFIFIPLFL